MIYDELTSRDWYMYRRGEMREYIRHQGIIDPDSRSRLYQWVDTGHSIHDNPWGIRDQNSGHPSDYLDAMKIFYSK